MQLPATLLTLALTGLLAGAHPGAGIAVDDQGRIFVAAGPMIVMIGTNGEARTIVHDRSQEKFYQLHHIQRAPDGSLVTASDLGNALWRFSAEGTLARHFPPPDDDQRLSIGLGGDPFAIDPAGNVYAVNSRQNEFSQVLRITPAGRLRVVAGGEWGFADGEGEQAKFGDLHGGSMVALKEGALLMTDDQCRVRHIAPDGRVTTLAGGAEAGYRDGPGPEARFEGARGLARDAAGLVLVAESVGRIRRIAPDGTVSTLAGKSGRGRVDGSLADAGFDGPTGIAVGPGGEIYVLEPHEPVIRKIHEGRVTTLLRGLP